MDEYEIVFHPDYKPEFSVLDTAVKDALGDVFDLIKIDGPALGRPHVYTLNGSKYGNMKEIRVKVAHGVWRVAFAIDPRRRALIICGADKSGVSTVRFYNRLIALADRRYAVWLAQM